jgi:hypothetical protein
MHVKYGQDKLHCMTWYVQGNDHGLTIHVNFMVKCVYDIWASDPMVVS